MHGASAASPTTGSASCSISADSIWPNEISHRNPRRSFILDRADRRGSFVKPRCDLALQRPQRSCGRGLTHQLCQRRTPRGIERMYRSKVELSGGVRDPFRFLDTRCRSTRTEHRGCSDQPDHARGEAPEDWKHKGVVHAEILRSGSRPAHPKEGANQRNRASGVSGIVRRTRQCVPGPIALAPLRRIRSRNSRGALPTRSLKNRENPS